MAVYNFSYVGLDQVMIHTQELVSAIRNIIISEDRIESYQTMLSNISSREPSTKQSEHFQKLASVHSNLEKIQEFSEEVKSYDPGKNGTRFISLYAYFGFYCFFQLFIGGLIQTSTGEDKKELYYFINVYNFFLIIPYIVLFLRANKKTPPTTFFLILLVHFFVTFIHWDINGSKNRIKHLLNNDLFFNISVYHITTALVCFLFFLIVVFEIYRIANIYYKLVPSFNFEVVKNLLIIILKVSAGVIILICYSMIFELLIKSNWVNQSHISVVSVFITLSPLVIVIARTLFNVISLRKKNSRCTK